MSHAYANYLYTASMNIVPTPIAGLSLITLQKRDDSRGFFARTWDPLIAKTHGVQERFDYSCISGSEVKHTLRGMHYQKEPHGEVKLVRCTKGAVFDVAVDVRPDSKTFKQWFGRELTAQNHEALLIPPGCAHGFLTLGDETEVLYAIAHAYVPEAACGMRFDDPAFKIVWPASPQVLSPRDAAYPAFV